MLPHGARSRYLAGRFYCGRSGPPVIGCEDVVVLMRGRSFNRIA